jgi:hypothetical protein
MTFFVSSLFPKPGTFLVSGLGIRAGVESLGMSVLVMRFAVHVQGDGFSRE